MSFTRLSTCMHLTAVFSLYQLHSVGGGDMDVVHKTINVYAPDRCVFFVPATDNVKININGNKIKQVNFTKFLGIYIDEHLSWAQHIEFF